MEVLDIHGKKRYIFKLVHKNAVEATLSISFEYWITILFEMFTDTDWNSPGFLNTTNPVAADHHAD